MATVHIVLGTVSARAITGATLPLLSSAASDDDTMASSGSSAASSLQGQPGQVWSITALGAIWVAFGANPTAGEEAGWLIAAGQTRDFAVSIANEKIAIKDAS